MFTNKKYGLIIFTAVAANLVAGNAFADPSPVAPSCERLYRGGLVAQQAAEELELEARKNDKVNYGLGGAVAGACIAGGPVGCAVVGGGAVVVKARKPIMKGLKSFARVTRMNKLWGGDQNDVAKILEQARLEQTDKKDLRNFMKDIIKKAPGTTEARIVELLNAGSKSADFCANGRILKKGSLKNAILAKLTTDLEEAEESGDYSKFASEVPVEEDRAVAGENTAANAPQTESVEFSSEELSVLRSLMTKLNKMSPEKQAEILGAASAK